MADWKPPTFEGEIKNYTPTLRDRIAYGISGLMSGKGELGPDRESMTRARMIANALEYTPLGVATAADDVTRATGRGDYLGAGTTLAMAGMPGPTPKGIKAYHGSPHSFDKFSMDKIGTGEGAQAYGHGLYFAEGEEVAKGYRDKLSLRDTGDYLADYFLKQHGGDYDAARNAIIKESSTEETHIAALKALDDLQRGGLKSRGSMYEVNINADPDQFLDWDKPLSEQPESVRGLFEGDPEYNAVVSKNPGNPFYNTPLRSEPAGSELWRKTVGTDDPIKRRQSAQDAAKKLAEKGIPGIKYLDQGSRAKGDGSRNYVVFDDKLIDIRRKYLLAALLGGGGLAAATNTGDAQAGTLQPQGGGGW